MGRGTVELRANQTETGSQSDRRRSARYRLDVSLIVRPKNNRSRAIHGRILDLSHGGISAMIAAELQLGEVVEVEFRLPYAAAGVLVQAAIRRRESYHYNLEFVHVSASDREKISRNCAAFALLQ